MPAGQLAERTADISGRAVTLTGPESGAWERSPVDLLRVIVALATFLVVLGLVEMGENTVRGLALDASDVGNAVPQFFVLSMFGLAAIFAMFVPPTVMVWVVATRNWRLVGMYLLTTSVAALTFRVLKGYLDGLEPELPERSTELPGWMAEDIWSPAWVAGFAAALVVSGPWMSRRWRRAGWVVLASIVPMRMAIGYDVPVGLLLGLVGGWLIGSVAVLAFGAPERNPSAQDVAEGMDRAGIHLTALRRAAVDARGSTPYFAVGTNGRGYFVKVLGADERSADLMFRVFRWLRMSDVGDERPFSTLRRAVEHEALVSMSAQRAGVTTPTIVAPIRLPGGSMALVYERVAGRSLDATPAGELSDALIRDIWGQIGRLRQHQIAHRDLRQANVLLADTGEPMVIDFGFGEVAAEDRLLDQDIAELVISTALDVGAERSVTDAVEAIGPDAVARAAPWMQALTIGGATRHDLKSHRKLLADIHDQVVQQTDLEHVVLVPAQRIRPRSVLTALLLFAVVWLLIPQLADLPRILQQVRGAQWSWLPPVLAFSLLTYVGAAMALAASVSRRLSVYRTTLVTLAGSFVNRVSPAKVGGIALNLRYLQKQGVETSVATASIGLYQAVGIVVHMSLLVMFGAWAGSTVSLTDLLPSGTVAFFVAAVVLTVAGIAVAVPRIRAMLRSFVIPQLSSVGRSLKELARSPVRMAVMVLGSACLTLGYIGALWASIQAFGGGLPIPAIAVVFLAGASVAAAAPTPGGIGAVEAALAAGLAALGLASDVAIPAVFLYRLATFWLPVVPGWLSFSNLKRRGDL